MPSTVETQISQAERLVRIEEKLDALMTSDARKTEEIKTWLAHCDIRHTPVDKAISCMRTEMRAITMRQKLLMAALSVFGAAFVYGLWQWFFTAVPVVVGH